MTVRTVLAAPAAAGRLVAGLLAAALALCLAAAGPVPLEGLAIVDVAVIDGTGAAPVLHRTVLVESGRIKAVTAADRPPPGRYRRIDGRGRTLIPGLWDMHVHALWDEAAPAAFFPRFVANGVTTVRDMGGNEAGERAAAEFAASRRAWSPVVFRSGRILDGPAPVDPSVSIAVSSPAEARAAVDRLADSGVHFIKVYTLLSRDAFLAAAARARERNLPVAGHLPTEVTIEDAAVAGMASIEHMQAEIGGYCPASDEAACGPIFSRLAAVGIAQTPTLIARYHRGHGAAHPEWSGEPEFALMPKIVRDYWRSALDAWVAAPPERALARLRDFEHEQRMAAWLAASDAVVLVGSDTGTPFAYPGRSLHEELELLVGAGMTPLEVISAATWGAARFMGAGERSGRIAPGYDADLVLLDADPSADIRATRRIRAVVRAGVLHDRAALNRVLAEGRP